MMHTIPLCFYFVQCFANLTPKFSTLEVYVQHCGLGFGNVCQIRCDTLVINPKNVNIEGLKLP